MIGRAWTGLELEAITYEIRAGRYRVIARGVCGIQVRTWAEIAKATWQASARAA